MTERIDAITSDDLLERFGLPASHEVRDEIRALLIEAIAREHDRLELGPPAAGALNYLLESARSGGFREWTP
jgi:hypothetical protein